MRIVTASMIMVILLAISVFYYQGFLGKSQTGVPSTVHVEAAEMSMPRAAEGHYMTDMELGRRMGDLIVRIHAGQAFPTKGKVFGLTSSLKIEVVGLDYRLEAERDGRKVLALRKRKQVIEERGDEILIRDPEVLLPEGLGKVLSVRIGGDGRIEVRTKGGLTVL